MVAAVLLYAFDLIELNGEDLRLLGLLLAFTEPWGQQKVTVEHVDVHAGGQAVVGMIESPRGGDQPKSEDQARAKQIGHAPQPAV